MFKVRTFLAVYPSCSNLFLPQGELQPCIVMKIVCRIDLRKLMMKPICESFNMSHSISSLE